jgi:hypothetical protein
MTENQPQAARAAVGSLPQTAESPQSAEAAHAAQFAPPRDEVESATAPTQSEEFGATLGAVDPAAFLGQIKGLVDMGTKVLSFLAKVPGPQQPEAQAALKVLTLLDTLLSRF